MELYLIRHAEAAPLGTGGVTQDEDRPLTARGQEQAQGLAAGLRKHGVRLGVVLTSPLLRARQTAEGILQHWPDPAPELRVCDALVPDVRPRKLSRAIAALGADVVALVGHQPDLGLYAAWLLGSRKIRIDLPKAGIACFHCPEGPGKGDGQLEWLVPPELFTV